MTRSIIVALVVALAALATTPIAKAKKGGGGNGKGPPPHGNAWGHYKNGWPGYWYGGYPYSSGLGFGPPPAYYGYGGPAPVYGYPPAYAPTMPRPAPEILPPPPPPY
jgi:hypothetical protein